MINDYIGGSIVHDGYRDPFGDPQVKALQAMISVLVDEIEAYRASEATPAQVQEWAQANKDGRLKVLPCRINAKIYEANKLFGKVFQRYANKEDMLTKIIPGWNSRYFPTSVEAAEALQDKREEERE